ncbi:MAG: NAD-dependent protein deacylase [Oscillospiraceae bacterium]
MENGEQKVRQLQDIISGSDNIVFFGGAGVSTESGLRDFRGSDGLYNQKARKWPFSPEEMASHSFYVRHKDIFYENHRENMLAKEVQPNPAHFKLAELEQAGKLRAIITQNIDNLHQAAGSQNVIELHGNSSRYYCEKCGKFFTRAYVKETSGIPHCDSCGGDVRPDVVLYEEALDNSLIEKAVQYIRNADVLIIGGTSLVVWPAAGLVDYFGGRHLVVINRDDTHKNSRADLVITDSIGKVLDAIHV